MKSHSLMRIHRITALILLITILFSLFFQISKAGPSRETNPFLNDPYDAVGSIAVQVALFVSFLSYARALRWSNDPAQEPKARLILRGDILVLMAIFITLCTDLAAEFAVPMPDSYGGAILRVELGGMFFLILVCGLQLWKAIKAVPTMAPPSDLSLADAIDDLWSLVQVPVMRAGSLLPASISGWIQNLNSDRIFARLHWIDPRRHALRFVALAGLFAGVLLMLGQLQEGLPPNLSLGLLVTGIFISVEFVATMLGYIIFGGYLGLRPRII